MTLPEPRAALTGGVSKSALCRPQGARGERQGASTGMRKRSGYEFIQVRVVKNALKNEMVDVYSAGEDVVMILCFDENFPDTVRTVLGAISGWLWG